MHSALHSSTWHFLTLGLSPPAARLQDTGKLLPAPPAVKSGGKAAWGSKTQSLGLGGEERKRMEVGFYFRVTKTRVGPLGGPRAQDW